MKDEKVIYIFSEVGEFAEDKDKAQKIRTLQILPAIKEGKTVVLDFDKVNSATQSFVHALISDIIRINGVEVLERLLFKNCNEIVKGIIEIVVDYMQDPLGIDSSRKSL